MWERTSSQDPDGYYSVMRLTGDGMAALRQLFPTGEANSMNAVLFSTGGIHGTYNTIETVEAGGAKSVTFCVIQPRIVCMRYGNAEPCTADDIAFLKKLRASSMRALVSIGVR